MDLVAFVEAVEPTSDGGTYLRLEVIPAERLADLRRKSSNAYDDNGRFDSSVVDLIATREQLMTRFGDGPVEENQWFALRLDRDGLPARQYIGAFGEEPAENAVAIATARRLGPEESLAIARWFSAPAQPDALPRLLAWEGRLTATTASRWPTYVAALDVGQGNCNVIFDIPHKPRIYFDFGGGCYWNKRTYPTPRQFRFEPDTVIVLSHWDADHWYSAQVVRAALDVTWLAPRQPMGPRAADFAATLIRRDRLIWWPDELEELAIRRGRIRRCKGANRNDSGLVMLVTLRGVGRDRGRTHGRRILLPADAAYSSIPYPDDGGYSGLVASHHGGHSKGSVPATRGQGIVVFSFGHGNTYGHPRCGSVVAHLDGGWRRLYGTIGGDVVFQPAGLRAAAKLAVGLVNDWDPLPPVKGLSVWQRLRKQRALYE